jgi:hypothetical protein
MLPILEYSTLLEIEGAKFLAKSLLQLLEALDSWNSFTSFKEHSVHLRLLVEKRVAEIFIIQIVEKRSGSLSLFIFYSLTIAISSILESPWEDLWDSRYTYFLLLKDSDFEYTQIS